jgi:acetyltransferase-like isoleucine patch superfamily enzyme
VTIGKFCSIAPGVSLVPGGIHPMTGVSTYPFLKRLGYEDVDSSVTRRGPIEVGHDVWIGTRALVLSGATVGNGAIVAAGATVVRDVPPYAIVAGTPARVIRYRLTQNEIDRLQGSRWWDYSDDILERNLDKLVGQDIEAFVKALPVNREADLG